MFRLSICIATYRRAAVIGETLASIIPQLEPVVEVVIVDGASPDATESVVVALAARHPAIRYFRESVNSGVDADYDKAVGYARGEYCWLMTDDDLLKPGAVARVLDSLVPGRELVVVNAEVRTADLAQTLQPSLWRISRDTEFKSECADDLLAQTASALSFIGSVVIRRDFWIVRERKPYYGSLFVHVGVLFQSVAPKCVLAIAQPLITIRYGNAMWTPRGFEIWMFKWPGLVWSFQGIADSAKSRVIVREPWRQFRKLLLYRAVGGYSMSQCKHLQSLTAEFRPRCVAWVVLAIPPRVANALASVFCLIFARGARMNVYDLSRSQYAGWTSRKVARVLGI